MSELHEFTVQADGITVLAGRVGASWSTLCSDADCPARQVIGFDGPEHAGRGAVGHLLWHAAGCPDEEG